MSSPSDGSLLPHVARGSRWLGSTGLIVLLLSVGSQIALGWLLVEEDFGVFALALGLASLVDAIKDGGVGHWLIQRPRESFETSLRHTFSISVWASILLALALAAAAPLASAVYGNSEIGRVLVVMAVSMPLGAYWTIASAKLTVDLEFRALASVNVGVAVVRTGLAILLAIAGFGAMSLALPLIAGNAFASYAGFRLTRLAPWKAAPKGFGESRRILRETGWAMSATLFRSLEERADYAVLGLVMSTPAVGLYYFAYQLPYRLALLAYGQSTRIVVPLLARIRSDTERLHDTLSRGASLLGVVVSPLFMALAVTVPDLESILWRGRWADAVAPAQVLAAVFPFMVLDRYGEMVLRSIGNFRAVSRIVLIRALAVGAVALLAGLFFGDDVLRVAVAIGGFMVIAGVLAFVRAIGVAGGRRAEALRGFILPYTWCAMSALLAYLAAHQLDLPGGFGHGLGSGLIFGALVGVGFLMYRRRLNDLQRFFRSLVRSRSGQ